ncbi:IS66 family insertion sequence element accessory protein TnpB, partial [Escherichia coli]|uniref:IS66 family insertion sequence element accessory protein TnpB n=27 Tax=Escherichia coli TaxID=562 RepID=UPI000C9B423D
MISLPSDTRISLVAGVTDMRKSFNGLGEQVQHVLDENPFSGHLFIFRGRRSDMIKILWADADGLCLFTKRLEEGLFIWPAVRDGKVSITRSQLAMLLDKLDWRQPKTSRLNALTMCKRKLTAVCSHQTRIGNL